MKVICIDDEKLALRFMKHLLEEIEGIEVIGTFQQPMKAYQFILENDVDVVFLDIHMPEMDGTELAEKIIEQKPHIDIVFVTAYNEYAVTAFDLNALDYLMKPVKRSRLQQTIERLKVDKLEDQKDSAEENILKICLSQNLSYATADDNFKPLKWRTAKSRELFLYLLQNHNRLVHKSTIMEMLWGDPEIDKGYSILYTTVYNVRRTLREFQQYLELKNTNDGYMLRLHHVKVDLHDWENQLGQLGKVNIHTIEKYEETMALNSGPYLAEYDYIWIESEKRRLENIWLQTAQKIAAFYHVSNKLNKVAEWYQTIIDRVPELEDAHFYLMKIYAELGRRELAVEKFKQYLQIQKSYGIEPNETIIEWYEQHIGDSPPVR